MTLSLQFYEFFQIPFGQVRNLESLNCVFIVIFTACFYVHIFNFVQLIQFYLWYSDKISFRLFPSLFTCNYNDSDKFHEQ